MQSMMDRQRQATANIVPVRESHINREMNRQAGLIEELLAVEALEVRLAGVLNMDDNSRNKIATPEQPALVPLAAMLSEKNDQLIRLREELDSLYQRIEL